MSGKLRIYLLAFLLVALLILHGCDAKAKKPKDKVKQKQLELRETNPPNFVRLVIMRLIYGIATQMGFEERVAGMFNGAFVPPNADDDDFGFGDLDGLDDAGLFKR